MIQERVKILRSLIHDEVVSMDDLLTLYNQDAYNMDDYYRDLFSVSVLVQNFELQPEMADKYFMTDPIIDVFEFNEVNLAHIYSLLLEIKSEIYQPRDRVMIYKVDFMRDLAIYLLQAHSSIYSLPADMLQLTNDMVKICNDIFIYDPRGVIIDDWTFDDLKRRCIGMSVNDYFKVRNDIMLQYKKENKIVPITRNRNSIVRNDFNPIVRQEENLVMNTLEKTTPINNELSGTLNKVKGVRTVGDVNGVDYWLLRHIDAHTIDPMDIELVVEYKYDGVATEVAMVGNAIIAARTRGDKEMGECNDITNLIKYFPLRHENAARVPDTTKYGMQYEIIMTKEDLIRYRERTGKDYANCRSAITSLVTSLTGPQLREFVTVAPIRTTLEFETRFAELDWIEKHFGLVGKGKLPVIIKGTYEAVLAQIEIIYKEFFESMDKHEFLYDGLVLSFNDKRLEKIIGRSNNTNDFSIALKFPNMVKQAKFLGYEPTVGKNGQITPMIKFSDTYFYGNKYTDASGASFGKIMDLGLRLGDIIDVEYTNYVMPAVLGRNEELSYFNNDKKPLPFSTKCPVCGTTLTASKSGRMLYCRNEFCPAQSIRRSAAMVAKLGFVNIAEATVEKLDIKSLTDFITITKERIIECGFTLETAKSILSQIDEFKLKTHEDSNIFGSIGIEGASKKVMEKIFFTITPTELIEKPIEELYQICNDISGIGEIIGKRIVDYFKDNQQEMRKILCVLKVQFSKGKTDDRKEVVFTNVSSKDKTIVMNKINHLYREGNGVTKTTALLISGTPVGESPSDKDIKAAKYDICIKRLSDFV